MIVSGLLKGLTSISFIALLLMLNYYMFAVVAIIFFSENDPWHFGDLQTAVLTLFRCSTLEDWTDVMYVNMFGCDDERWGYSEELQSMRPDIVAGGYEGCTSPMAQPVLSASYFLVFTVMTA